MRADPERLDGCAAFHESYGGTGRSTMQDLAQARERMVERQLVRRGITDRDVLAAMRHVPREAFLAEGYHEFAYEDSPLPIEEGQTISQPFIVAAMLAAAELKPGDTVMEIGTGSGYAAAVIAEIVRQVHSVERHARLADLARQRLRLLKYGNVEVHTGDGTLGLPDLAPFDAILAAAGGPSIPATWKDQLAIGGRLVMPVGKGGQQRLVKLVRRGTTEFEEHDLGGVMFVPLIGAHGWSDEQARSPGDPSPARPRPAAASSTAQMIRAAAEPLPDLDDPAFGRLFDRFGDRRVVLLGEASHGTSEFYRARAAITRRLIEAHGFNIVAVEADWPDAAAIDRDVRGRPRPLDDEPPFRRFPTWMWRNTDVDAFIGWLRRHNEQVEPQRRTGFFGLDLYNLSGSIAAVLNYLDKVDPDAARIARERYGCLTPWQKDPATYGRAVLNRRYDDCTDAVVAQLRDLLAKRLEYASHDGEQFLDAAQNARLVASAERYYRIMYYGAAESWNLRDTHMFETLTHLLDAHGPASKAVVWAHNSHIGNAAATEMGTMRDELNIGQLCRERFGEQAALIGFGTHAGTVAAASDWDAPMEVKKVRPSHADSYERLLHDSNVSRFLLDLREGRHEPLRSRLLEPRLERFIGVIYRPETELHSHYAEAVLPRQFDAMVWFDTTSAVTPLPTRQAAGAEETFPFGL
jgi:protein-L-isoaspartate(D-aspartate) O-methyltransferase